MCHVSHLSSYDNQKHSLEIKGLAIRHADSNVHAGYVAPKIRQRGKFPFNKLLDIL